MSGRGYSEGWITVPGKGRRWRTADGTYMLERPAGSVLMGALMSGVQSVRQTLRGAGAAPGRAAPGASGPRDFGPNYAAQESAAVASAQGWQDSRVGMSRVRPAANAAPAVPGPRDFGPNYAAQESLQAANAQGWQDSRAGLLRSDPNALIRKQGQIAFRDGERVGWDKQNLSWVSAPQDDQRRQGDRGEEFYDAYKKEWRLRPNYQSTPRPAPQTALEAARQTITETINQVRNPLDSFTRTAVQHGLPNAIREAGDRGLIDVPTLTREGFANAVSAKALLGELGRPLRMSPPPDARKAFSDNFNAEAVVSPSGKTASYSDRNPNWDPALKFAKGPGGEVFNHRALGRYNADLEPGPDGRKTARITDFWDTNWSTEQHRADQAGRARSLKDRAVMLTSQVQESGGLNRSPMGIETQWDVAPPRAAAAVPQQQAAGPGVSALAGDAAASAGRALQAARVFQSQKELRPGIQQGSSYVVQQGDTLWDIAQRTGRTVDALAAESGISNPGLIMPGQRIAF